MNGELKIFSGNANLPLAEKITNYLKISLNKVSLKRFADGEINLQFIDNVRGADVFIIQPTNPPAENLLELYLMVCAAKNSSAKRITAVIPYFGYARQDRKDKPRKTISSKNISNIIALSGVNRVLLYELHNDTIQAFFDIPGMDIKCDNLYSSFVFIPALEKIITNKDTATIVAPDVGGLKKARAFSTRLGTKLALIDKQRSAENSIKEMTLIGDVTNQDVILLDDIVDTAGTLCDAANLLHQKKARSIIVVCTHGLLSKDAVKKLQDSKISKIFLSDTIKIPDEKIINKFEFISSAPILGEAIKKIHNEESLSVLIN